MTTTDVAGRSLVVAVLTFRRPGEVAGLLPELCRQAERAAASEDAEAPHFVAQRLLPGLFGVAFYAGLALLLYAGVRRRLRLYREG